MLWIAVCSLAVLALTTAAVSDTQQSADLVEQLIRDSYAISVSVADVKQSDSGCQCVQYNCGCCAHLDIPKLKINDTGCVNVSYLPDQYGISLVFTLDGRVWFNSTVSARNPPPLCFGIPYLEKEASLCIDFYNLTFTDRTFSGCIKLQARLLVILVESVDLGCFHFPLPANSDSSRVASLVQLLRHRPRLY